MSRYIYIAIMAILLVSCHSQKNMTYFEDIDATAPVALQSYLTKIEPADQLIITVSSKDPKATANYNLPYANPIESQSTTRQAVAEQQTYIVDSKGYIDFPVLGRLYVEGMTIEQLRDMLIEKISKDVDDPVVNVSMLGAYVNLGGEVQRPGRAYFTSPRFTVLDALAAVGDLTQYGRRDNVLLIREVDGKREHVRLNLNSADVLASPYFYLKQNDYIYVEPDKVRKDNAEYNSFNSYKLSVISTIVSGSASVISLIIALSR